jgi:hypothetical protein
MRAKRQQANNDGGGGKRDVSSLSRTERKSKNKKRKLIAELSTLITDVASSGKPAAKPAPASAAETTTDGTDPSAQFGTKISAVLTKMFADKN